MHSKLREATLKDFDFENYYASGSYEEYIEQVDKFYHSIYKNRREGQDYCRDDFPKYAVNLIIYVRMILEIHEVYTAPVVHHSSVRDLLDRIGSDPRLGKKVGYLIEAIYTKMNAPADQVVKIHDIGNGDEVDLTLDHIKYCLTNQVRAIFALVHNKHIDIDAPCSRQNGEDVYPGLKKPDMLVHDDKKYKYRQTAILNIVWDAFFQLLHFNYNYVFYILLAIIYANYLIETYGEALFSDELHTGVTAAEYVASWKSFFGKSHNLCDSFFWNCIRYIKYAPTFPEGVKIDVDTMKRLTPDSEIRIPKTSFFTLKHMKSSNDKRRKKLTDKGKLTEEEEEELKKIGKLDALIAESMSKTATLKEYGGDWYINHFKDCLEKYRAKYPESPACDHFAVASATVSAHRAGKQQAAESARVSQQEDPVSSSKRQ